MNGKKKSNDKLDVEKLKKKKKQQLTKDLLKQQIYAEWPTLLFGSIAMMGSALSNQALPRLFGRLIDSSSSSSSSSSSLDQTKWLTYVVVIGGASASFIRTTLLNRAQESIMTRLRNQAVQVLFTAKDVEWFQNHQQHTGVDEKDSNTGLTNGGLSVSGADKNNNDNNEKDKKDQQSTTTPGTTSSDGISPGAIVTILNEDVALVAQTITSTLTNLLRSTSSMVFSIYHMYTLNPTLLGVSLGIVPAIGTFAVLLSKRLKQITQQQRAMATNAFQFVEERLAHITMVQMSAREWDEVNTYREQYMIPLQKLGYQAAFQQGRFMAFLFSATASSLLLVVYTGSKSIAKGTMTSGQLTTFATYSFLLGLGTSGVTKAFSELRNGMVSATRYYDLIHHEEEHEQLEPEKGKEKPAKTLRDETEMTYSDDDVYMNMDRVTAVTLDQVSFAYKNNLNKTVLENIDMTLKRGQVVALVGKNGCGKSTLSRLLAGLHKPITGRVQVVVGEDEMHDLTKLSKSAKKRLVQVIPQQVALFNTTILENVRYSNPQASLQEVEEACKLANCQELIAKVPGGLDYTVGWNGSKLSGGERQRLALARALVTDPALLILDEAASNLDAEGETAVAEAVKACRQENRALLLITHDPNSLQLADQVIVLGRHGKIAERGSYHDLRNNPKSELCLLMPGLA